MVLRIATIMLLAFRMPRFRLPMFVSIPRRSIRATAAPMWTVGIWSMPCRSYERRSIRSGRSAVSRYLFCISTQPLRQISALYCSFQSTVFSLWLFQLPEGRMRVRQYTCSFQPTKKAIWVFGKWSTKRVVFSPISHGLNLTCDFCMPFCPNAVPARKLYRRFLPVGAFVLFTVVAILRRGTYPIRTVIQLSRCIGDLQVQFSEKRRSLPYV